MKNTKLRTALLATVAGFLSQPASLAGQDLSGFWSGEILNAAGEVEATIEFELERHRGDTLHGRIYFVRTGTEELVEPDRWASKTDHQERYDELHVDFVPSAAGGFQGAITPYRDPGCGCAIQATLTGMLDGDRLTGVFNAHHGSGLDERGTWWVERKE